MKQFTVTSAESGQRCLKYCEKILPNAGTGFLHKMFRKKNITLNDKKSDGSERLNTGDIIKIFFADETFEKFSGKAPCSGENPGMHSESVPPRRLAHAKALDPAQIIYEDEHVLFYNKPVGMLSQKAKPQDISLNELLLAYVNTDISKNAGISKASVCNRLDRNTSGIVVCGKTYLGLRTMNAMIADRSIGKYYHCLAEGIVREPILLKGYLRKDERTNKVTVRETPFEGAFYIETEISVLGTGDNMSLLEIHLITGKTHQIRSHLAWLGHAIVGDYKYGQREVNDFYQKKYGVKSQLLHAYRLELPAMEGEFSALGGKTLIAPKPELFMRIEKEEIHGHVEF